MPVEVIQLDDEVVTIQVLEQGPPGPPGEPGEPSHIPGPPGTPGANGKTVLSGAGAPSSSIGVPGDFYIDTTADAIYGPKVAGAWGPATSLIGPQGPVGPMGPQGQVAVLVGDTPPVGAQHNSLWFETDSGIFFINYFDGNSAQWVALSGGGSVGGGGGGGDVIPSDINPKMDGAVTPGSDNAYARSDHVHPSDTSRAAANNPSITGNVNLTSAGTVGISGSLGDMFFGINGAAGAAKFVVNSKADGSGTNVLSIGETGLLPTFKSDGHLQLVLDGTVGSLDDIIAMKGGKNRWVLRLGDNAAESGGNVGCNFQFLTYDDAGSALGMPLVITRSNSCIGVNGSGAFSKARADLAAFAVTGPGGGGIMMKDGAAFGGMWMESGQLHLASNPGAPALTTQLIVYDSGCSVTGNLSVNSSIYCNGTVCGAGGKPMLQISGTYVALFDYTGNTSLLLGQGDNNIYRANTHTFQSFQGAYPCASLTNSALSVTGRVEANVGYRYKAGTNGAFGGSNFNLDYQAPWINAWVDSTQVGTLAYASDYRIKKDIAPLTDQWETVKALKPIKYTHQEFSPPSHVEHNAALKEKDADAETHPLVTASDVEQWGFVAHELQETLTPSAASGVKDAPDLLQSPNPWTIIASLTKALQEAMVRIERLEQGTLQDAVTRLEKMERR